MIIIHSITLTLSSSFHEFNNHKFCAHICTTHNGFIIIFNFSIPNEPLRIIILDTQENLTCTVPHIH
ncbi:hypothetical protein F383_08924 [Gossypium arboreum]|uniref:Uncharacterized protein n=1 Tax=Gossypium arboreum TaxID=29729 RepID=A0A0B0PPZ5_GOSAR|nr:hypothetical protein F383_08924 [Gossypium arboreum]